MAVCMAASRLEIPLIRSEGGDESVDADPIVSTHFAEVSPEPPRFRSRHEIMKECSCEKKGVKEP